MWRICPTICLGRGLTNAQGVPMLLVHGTCFKKRWYKLLGFGLLAAVKSIWGNTIFQIIPIILLMIYLSPHTLLLGTCLYQHEGNYCKHRVCFTEVLQPALPNRSLQWCKYCISALSNTTATSHVWLLCTWNMASINEKLDFYPYVIIIT